MKTALTILVTVIAFASPAAAAAASKCEGRTATIVGTDRADEIRGTAARDVIVARRGPDHIRSLDGNDIICAGRGDDSIEPGRGNDRTHAGKGDDFLGDLPFRPDGRAQAGKGEVRVDRLAGHDWAAMEDGKDTVFDGAGDDTYKGGDGDDQFWLHWGRNGDDLFVGGAGVDGIGVNEQIAEDNFSVNLMTGEVRGAGIDTVRSMENVEGDIVANNTLIGNAADNNLVGGDGEDHLEGLGGDDILVSWLGVEDFLDGGDGTDACEYQTVLGSPILLNCETLIED